MTQDDMGKALNVSRVTISRYETDREPDIETLRRYSDLFGVSLDYLAGRTSKRTNGLPPQALEEVRRGAEAYPVNRAKIELPIYGEIAAGIPSLAAQTPIGYEKVEAEEVSHDVMSYFWLRVKGNSMVNAGIVDGGLVLVHCQDSIEDGQIAVVRVDDEEATVKRVRLIGDQIMLKPENPTLVEDILPINRVHIVGRVKLSKTRFM